LKRACLTELGRHRLIVIGLTASTDTLIEREKQRGDRALSTAVRQAESAHNDVHHDILLDTDNADPATLADQARDQLRTRFGLE
jgi:chloramphenicol 3-O-phosphotransferase